MDRACYFGDDMSVQMLLNAGAESDGVNDYKAFARFEPIWHLTQAASGGHFKIVDMLLKAGATVDLRCGEGHTALFVAVINKHTEVVQRLIDTGADTSLKVNGETVLEVARSQGFDEIVKIIAGAKGAMEKAR
jgi:ankyrin repeat protein